MMRKKPIKIRNFITMRSQRGYGTQKNWMAIRAGNVWYGIQQVFYLMHENIEGCFAQKPLKSAQRIIDASSKEKDIIVDFFGHAGSTLLQAEISKRTCYTMDINPTYCKIIVARLLHYRRTGETGWGKTNKQPCSRASRVL
jgi:site-specific DNA-methyltransferase (adenine-specific)